MQNKSQGLYSKHANQAKEDFRWNQPINTFYSAMDKRANLANGVSGTYLTEKDAIKRINDAKIKVVK